MHPLPTHTHPSQADKELEVLREAREKGSSEQSSLISSLRQQLSEAHEAKESAEQRLQELKTKVDWKQNTMICAMEPDS